MIIELAIISENNYQYNFFWLVDEYDDGDKYGDEEKQKFVAGNNTEVHLSSSKTFYINVI